MADRPTNADCIFCKIVAGDIPCFELLSNDHVLAFLDVGPLSPGHTLVIPKGHWVMVDRVPDDVAGAIGAVLPRLSRAVTRATGAKAWNVLQNNGRAAHQAVDHVHFHIIPRFAESGLGIEWPARELDKGQAKRLTETIRDALA